MLVTRRKKNSADISLSTVVDDSGSNASKTASEESKLASTSSGQDIGPRTFSASNSNPLPRPRAKGKGSLLQAVIKPMPLGSIRKVVLTWHAAPLVGLIVAYMARGI